MRTIILLIAALAFTAALPMDETDASHEEAADTIAALLQKGKSKNACKDLADATISEINTAVNALQKTMNAMDNGSKCKDSGKSAVDKAKNNKKKADKKARKAKDHATKVCSAKVDFKPRDLDAIKGDWWKAAPEYTSVKKTCDKAKDAKDKADGAAKQADKSLKDAKKVASNEKHKCLCKAKAQHADAEWDLKKSNSAENHKAWTKSHHMICVIDGKSAKACKVPATPKVTAKALSKAAANEHCGKPYNKVHYKKLCMDVPYGKAKKGAHLQVWTCHSGNAQRFHMAKNPGHLKFQSNNGGKDNKCMDLSGGRQKNGNKIQLWNCGANNSNQIWSYDHRTEEMKLNKNHGKCVDVPNASNKRGTKLQIWKCNKGTAQKWVFGETNYQ